MIVRALDGNGDWQLGKGKSDYKKNRFAVAQSIQTRLKSFLGDCFFATNEGIDWFNLLGAKSKIAIQLAVSATILNTPDVIGLVEVLVNLDENRKILIQYTVNTSYGQVSGSVGV